MYQRMILTDDGSELARAAIARAAALARAAASEVLVLRVSHAAGEDPTRLTAASWHEHVGGSAATRDRDAPIEAEPHLSEVVDALSAAGVAAVGSLVVRGEPGPAIAEAARRLAADVLVMSSHGLGGMKRAVLGSVAEHVLRHGHGTPILLCHPIPAGGDAGIRRVLLTLDGSELSASAGAHAEAIAAAADAELVLLRATDSAAQLIAATTPVSVDVPGESISVETAEQVAAEQRAAAREALESVATRLRADGLARVSLEVVDGDAGEAIVAAAARLECDLIVMATHGRGGLGRVLFGSVADYVTRHVAHSAVLLVRPTS